MHKQLCIVTCALSLSLGGLAHAGSQQLSPQGPVRKALGAIQRGLGRIMGGHKDKAPISAAATAQPAVFVELAGHRLLRDPTSHEERFVHGDNGQPIGENFRWLEPAPGGSRFVGAHAGKYSYTVVDPSTGTAVGPGYAYLKVQDEYLIGRTRAGREHLVDPKTGARVGAEYEGVVNLEGKIVGIDAPNLVAEIERRPGQPRRYAPVLGPTGNVVGKLPLRAPRLTRAEMRSEVRSFISQFSSDYPPSDDDIRITDVERHGSRASVSFQSRSHSGHIELRLRDHGDWTHTEEGRIVDHDSGKVSDVY